MVPAKGLIPRKGGAVLKALVHVLLVTGALVPRKGGAVVLRCLLMLKA